MKSSKTDAPRNDVHSPFLGLTFCRKKTNIEASASLSVDNKMSDSIQEGHLGWHGIWKFLFKFFHLIINRCFYLLNNLHKTNIRLPLSFSFALLANWPQAASCLPLERRTEFGILDAVEYSWYCSTASEEACLKSSSWDCIQSNWPLKALFTKSTRAFICIYFIDPFPHNIFTVITLLVFHTKNEGHRVTRQRKFCAKRHNLFPGFLYRGMQRHGQIKTHLISRYFTNELWNPEVMLFFSGTSQGLLSKWFFYWGQDIIVVHQRFSHSHIRYWKAGQNTHGQWSIATTWSKSRPHLNSAYGPILL